MISVIIPVYNVRQFLNEAVESVIGQSFTDWEMILVDDGSTDGCSEICDDFARSDSRIKVLHQENKGLSAARNAGLDNCKGDFIAFLDSDDAFLPDALSKSMEMMLKHDADMAEFNISVLETSGKLADNTKEGTRGVYSAAEGIYTKRESMALLVEGKISTAVWNKLYKRRIWDGLRFPPGRNYEDLDIILQLREKSERMYFISDPLLVYRIRQNSITMCRSLNNLRDHSASFVSYTRFIESHIPEYFTYDQLEIAYRSRYKYMLYEYCICSLSQSPDKKAVLNYLKQEIDNSRKKVDLEKVPFKTKAAYFLTSRFPWVIPATFGLYHSIRKAAAKIMAK